VSYPEHAWILESINTLKPVFKCNFPSAEYQLLEVFDVKYGLIFFPCKLALFTRFYKDARSTKHLKNCKTMITGENFFWNVLSILQILGPSLH